MIGLSTTVWLVLGLVLLVLGTAFLFALELGLGVLWDALWTRGKKKEDRPRFPWSDRIG